MTTDNPINDPTNWEKRLAGEIVPTHSETPDFGFYRVLTRDKTAWRAVAYWWDEETGELRCQLAGENLDQDRACTLWPFASENPITEAVYLSVCRGARFPDENEAVAGHNRAPVEDTLDAIADRIEDFAREAERLIKAGAAPSQDIANQASDVANTLGELESKTTALHKVEKQPHLDAGRACDAKWFKLRDRAADVKRRLKAIVLTPFLTKKDEETSKAQIAAITSGAAPEGLPPQRIVAGSTKRSTGLRTQTSAEVDDWEKLILSLKDHPDIRDCAQRIANASAKAGHALPGTKINKAKVAA